MILFEIRYHSSEAPYKTSDYRQGNDRPLEIITHSKLERLQTCSTETVQP